MLRATLIFSLLAMVCSLTSCGKRYRLRLDDMTTESSWPFARRDVSASGAWVTAGFSGKLDVLWEARTGGKPAGPLTIMNGALVFPETKKRLRFYRAENGENLGKMKTRGIPQSGAAIRDSIVCFSVGPKRNRLYGYNLVSRKSLWERDLKDAAPGPIIVDKHLLVTSLEGRLFAFGFDDGASLWDFDPDRRLSASASYAGGRLFQPADHGRLYVLAIDDGRQLCEIDLKGPLTSMVVATEDRAYAADILGSVYALSPDDCSVVWEMTLEAPVWCSPALMDDRLYVATTGGQVTALDAESGQRLWIYEAIEVIKVSPLVIGDYVIVGTMAGNVLVLRADNGSLVDSARVEGPIAVGPVTDGNRVFVATQKGRIVCFGEENGKATGTD
ncbi:MAG: hypothetical protein DRP45_00535 [Candidatus Zixiibacteriota bacterium]|nr:MAG: hypothetical protein DRP45_00535 [candidate division Zixibacteria bacterium]